MYTIGEDSPTIYWQEVARVFNSMTGKKYTGLRCREYNANSYKPCPEVSKERLEIAVKVVNSQRRKKALTCYGKEEIL